MESIVFGGGCFWCIEAIFSRVKGVLKVSPGYSGGHKANPSYQEVCTGTTGHAEVVKVDFDEDHIDEMCEFILNLKKDRALYKSLQTHSKNASLKYTPENANKMILN